MTSTLTIAWIALPFFVGFLIYLLPKLDRWLALGMAIASGAYAVSLFAEQSPLSLELLDHFGVTLLIDSLSGYFILTNALVTAAVILYCWHSGKSPFFMRKLLFCTAASMPRLCVQILLVYMWH